MIVSPKKGKERIQLCLICVYIYYIPHFCTGHGMSGGTKNTSNTQSEPTPKEQTKDRTPEPLQTEDNTQESQDGWDEDNWGELEVRDITGASYR